MAINPEELQQPRRGFLGNVDPFQIALFLSPLAEMFRHGAGSSLLSGALQGMQQRSVLQQRQREHEEVRAERHEARRQQETERNIRLIEIGLRNPRMLPFLRGLPGFPQMPDPDPEQRFTHPDYPGTDLSREEYLKLSPPRSSRERETVPITEGGQTFNVSPESALAHTRAVSESGQERLKRLRAELKDIVDKGREGMEGRVRQIAPILGLDLSQSVRAYRESVGARSQKERIEAARESRLERFVSGVGGVEARALRREERAEGREAARNARERLEKMQDQVDSANATYQAERVKFQAAPAGSDERRKAQAAMEAAFARGETLGRRMNRELGQQGRVSPQPAAPARAQGFEFLPPAAQHKGQIVRDTKTGRRLQSNGQKWVPVK